MSPSSTQEAFALVTCALCPKEFFRKDRSGILIENHQQQPNGESTPCAICPACAVKIRENDPHGQIKDLDEIREHVKRMQDYTEGLEEAFDELLEDFEKSEAAKEDLQKRLDTSQKNLDEMQETKQLPQTEVERKLQEAEETIESLKSKIKDNKNLKEDWKRKFLDLSKDIEKSSEQRDTELKDIEAMIEKFRKADVKESRSMCKGYIDIWQHSLDDDGVQGWPEAETKCVRRNDPDDSLEISYGISSNNKLLAVTAEGGMAVKIFHIEHGLISYCRGLDFGENKIQPEFSKLTDNGRYLVSIMKEPEQPNDFDRRRGVLCSAVIHDFGDNMEHAEAPLRSIVPALKVKLADRAHREWTIQFGIDTMLVCNHDIDIPDSILQLSTKQCFEFHARRSIEISSLARCVDFTDNMMIDDYVEDNLIIYEANFQQKEMLRTEVPFAEEILEIDNFVVHPLNRSIFAVIAKDNTAYRSESRYLRIFRVEDAQSSDGGDQKSQVTIQPLTKYVKVTRGWPPRRFLWHPAGRYIVCVFGFWGGGLSIRSQWWYDFKTKRNVDKQGTESVPRMLFEKATRHFEDSDDTILDVAFSRDGNSLVVTHQAEDENHEYLKIFTVTEKS